MPYSGNKWVSKRSGWIDRWCLALYFCTTPQPLAKVFFTKVFFLGKPPFCPALSAGVQIPWTIVCIGPKGRHETPRNCRVLVLHKPLSTDGTDGYSWAQSTVDLVLKAPRCTSRRVSVSRYPIRTKIRARPHVSKGFINSQQLINDLTAIRSQWRGSIIRIVDTAYVGVSDPNDFDFD